MASMARSLDIPARVAVGFARAPRKAIGTVAVGLRDAHAWPELYFEGVGWTRFEPTPTRGSVPAYTVPDTPESTLPDPGTAVRGGVLGALGRPVGERGLLGAAAAAGRLGEGERPWRRCPRAATGRSGTRSWRGRWAVSPSSCCRWRRCCGRLRARSVRLGAHGRSEAGTAAHTLAVWDELIMAWDVGISPDSEPTPRKAAARIVRLGRLDPDAAASVHRVWDAVERLTCRGRAHGGPHGRRGWVAAGLSSGAGRGMRLRALLLPRSTVRVVWAVSARWAAVRGRGRPAAGMAQALAAAGVTGRVGAGRRRARRRPGRCPG
ncbi:hypothetical protein SHIRM173S_07547 [Streptomyces hirsutus]